MTRLSPHLIVFATMALFLAAPAHAQSGGSGCPPPSVIEQNDQIIVANTYLPMQISIEITKATCRAHDFLVNFFKREPDPDKASLDDYIEASKPDDGTGGDQKYRAKLRDMPSPTKNPGWNPNPATSIVVLPPNTSGGVPVLFQANAPGGPTPASVAEIQGNGTLLSTEGMKRGTFDKGKLNGVGEEIDPNGTWRSGTYESGRNMGQVWEVRKVDGKTYLASGSVVNGKLDGMIERIFADGSTQFEDWEGGKLMQVGVRAPKGQSAMAPQARYKRVEEAELEDAYKHTGPRTKIAPGTTFDPARSIRSAGVSNKGRLISDAELARLIVSHPPLGLAPSYRKLVEGHFGPYGTGDLLSDELAHRCGYFKEGWLRDWLDVSSGFADPANVHANQLSDDKKRYRSYVEVYRNMTRSQLLEKYGIEYNNVIEYINEHDFSSNVKSNVQTIIFAGQVCGVIEAGNILGYGTVGDMPKLQYRLEGGN